MNSVVQGAAVEIRQGESVCLYREEKGVLPFSGNEISIGKYVPMEDAPLVMPQTEYQLTVRSDGREARAVTVTPERIQVDRSVLVDEKTLEVLRDLKTFADGEDAVYSASANQVNYLDGLLEVRIAPVDVPAYQVGIFSLDLDSERVLEADFLDEEDYADLEREESSPPLEASDGRLRLPWFAVYFGGRHLIRIYALDKNWFDFARSSPDENGGGFAGSLAGDRFERPLFHVEGGIGLFGSASVDSVGFFVLPKK